MTIDLDFSDVDLYAIDVTVGPRRENGHARLSIYGGPYADLLMRWDEQYNCMHYCPSCYDDDDDNECSCGWKCEKSHPGFKGSDIPSVVLDAASTIGIMLESTAERLVRELKKSAMEHECAERPREDRCSVLETSGHGDELGCEFERTISVKAQVPAEHGRLWKWRAQTWLAEAAQKIGQEVGR